VAEKPDNNRDFQTAVQAPDPQKLANQQAEGEADLLLAKGEYAAAIEKYQKLDLTQARTLNKMGLAYEYLGGMKMAKADYQQAIRLDPKFSIAYNNLATVYYSEGDNKNAEKFYKKAIKLDPQYASAYKNLGTSYFARRKYGKGSEMYAVAMKIDPGIFTREKGLEVSQADRDLLAEMNYFLAELCAEHEQMNAALAYLDKAVGYGFHDARRLFNDRALASVREMPGFEGLLRNGLTK
jgi:tetratricopeptide (TPR) repeat protein